MTERCLYCYEPLQSQTKDYHPSCAQRLFGVKTPPLVEFDLVDIERLAKQEINQRISIPGVQKKLSLDLVGGRTPRLTIVGLWGEFIFKPPTSDYPQLPVVEDLCMHVAADLGIRVATHGLIRLRGKELGYISRRFDRHGQQRLAVEDFCQLTETLTNDKYYSSVEKVGKTLRRFSDNPGFDVQRLLEIVLFSYLTGNSDMHLKNYSLLRDIDGELGLAPAYDLVPTQLLLPDDKEESALSINGRKHKLRMEDFLKLVEYLRLDRAFFTETLDAWRGKMATIKKTVDASFVPNELKRSFLQLFSERTESLI